MTALLAFTLFVAGFAIGLAFAGAIARQRVKRWAVVREIIGQDD